MNDKLIIILLLVSMVFLVLFGLSVDIEEERLNQTISSQQLELQRLQTQVDFFNDKNVTVIYNGCEDLRKMVEKIKPE